MTLVYTPETRPAEAPTSFEDFLEVLAGLRLSPASTHIDLDHRRLEVYGSSVKLSNKEYELLAYLAQRADEVVSVSYTHLDVYKRQEYPFLFQLYAAAVREKLLPGLVD